MTDEPPAESDRTIIRPSATPSSVAPAADRTVIEPAQSAAPRARTADGRIGVGDVLNDIFEVKRFIARGGMGEVFEGINVNTDERLAIKVILPHLADDPNVQDMFRNEARTLQKLSHPSLVKYILLGKERQSGVFYIVTEFIDGANMADVLADLKPTPADLVMLTRRLAEGLGAAHALGAVHRDMAPDNVILAEGKFDRPRIIDFGIAKDLNPGSRTIIGDGFGGKLSFVAPEQLGDFDRQVGAWSDVYSLALVIMAVAQGHKVDMGSSFVEAMDRRRKGVDTSAAPPEIRGVLDQMLTPDPAQRLRSMDAVLAALDEPLAAAKGKGKLTAAKLPAAKPAAARPTVAKTTPPPAEGKPDDAGGQKNLFLIGGAAVLALAIAGGAYFAFSGPSAPPAVAPAATGAAAPALTETVRTAVTAALPTVPCTWLDLTRIDAAKGSIAMAFTGVAGRPAEAQAAISRVVAGTGARIGDADFNDVAPIAGTECASIDAFRQIRADPSAKHLSTAQRSYTMGMMTAGTFKGQVGASAIVDLNLGDIGDFALYGLEPSGGITPLVPNRAVFDKSPKGSGTQISDLGRGHYRLQIDANHSGWSGILLLTGNGGFSDALLVGKAGVRAAGWDQRFAAAAAAGKWKSEMVWYKTVEEGRPAG